MQAQCGMYAANGVSQAVIASPVKPTELWLSTRHSMLCPWRKMREHFIQCVHWKEKPTMSQRLKKELLYAFLVAFEGSKLMLNW